MAKVTTVVQLLDRDEYANGQTVMCVKGKLTGIFEKKSGENANGPWELQNGELTDSTGKIPVSFSGNSQPTSAKNRSVTISAIQSEKHGWIGVKIEDREYEKDGKTVRVRQLKVTSTGLVEYEGGTPQESSSKPQQSNTSPATTTPRATRHPSLFLKDAIKLHFDITILVNEAYGEKANKETVASLFIEACRNGYVHNYTEESDKPIKKAYPPAPLNPKEWAKCVITAGVNEGKTLQDVTDEDLKKYFDFYDKKQDNSPLAECVYQAAKDRGLLPPPPPPVKTEEDAALDIGPDEIPF